MTEPPRDYSLEETFDMPSDAPQDHGPDLGDPFDTGNGTSSDPPRGNGTSPAGKTLPIFRASSLAGSPAPRREFHVEGLIPARTVTLLVGDGATGKSLLVQQLCTSTALPGTTWLGLQVVHGPSLFLTAEDEKDEVWRRMEDIARDTGKPIRDMSDLHVISLAGEDALLGIRKGDVIVPTARFEALEAAIRDIKPKLTTLDTLADLFAGEENSRAHARQFIGLLRGLAIRQNTTIVLLAHPSLSGMSSGAGTSGSTAWSNSARSRLYLERVKGDAGSEADPNIRVLKTMKANYAASGTEIRMRWERGVFVATPTPGATGTGLAAFAAKENADQVFLNMLATYKAERRNVSPSKSMTYAPTVFAQDTRSQGLGMHALQAAMNRLFTAKRIATEEYGPPSKQRQRLVIAEKSETK